MQNLEVSVPNQKGLRWAFVLIAFGSLFATTPLFVYACLVFYGILELYDLQRIICYINYSILVQVIGCVLFLVGLFVLRYRIRQSLGVSSVTRIIASVFIAMSIQVFPDVTVDFFRSFLGDYWIVAVFSILMLVNGIILTAVIGLKKMSLSFLNFLRNAYFISIGVLFWYIIQIMFFDKNFEEVIYLCLLMSQVLVCVGWALVGSATQKNKV